MKPVAVKFVLLAADMNRAVRFYRDALGLEEGFVSDHWSELSFGEAVIGLHAGGDESPRETGLSIQYEDVEAAYDRALAAGAREITRPERREGEPILLSRLEDPEGNEIALTQWVG